MKIWLKRFSICPGKPAEKGLFMLLTACLFCLVFSANAQMVTRYVEPAVTGTGIRNVHGPHVAMYDQTVRPGKKLFVFIVGTNGKATDAKSMCRYFAGRGYNTLSIDYRNTVITTACTKSEDSTCFDGFRKEIMFGTPVSPVVDVDSANSIINRISKLLAYLAENDKAGNWENFTGKNGIRWNRVNIGGHSQGAGHAAFTGQNFRVKRVLIFSGPQDYLSVFDRPAGWLSAKSKTPRRRYAAFLHKKDPFNMRWQLACNQKLIGKNSIPLDVLPGIHPTVPASVFGTKQHIFLNDMETENAHGSTLFTAFSPVWDAMMGLK